ncbi:MAG: glycosyltransferase family 2 protein [Anaerolineae bacterium]
MTPELSVVIVNLNTRGLLSECLASVYQTERAVEVWVVDNGSTDGSVAMVQSQFPQVRLIANTDNRGFSTANNQAIERASARHILLLISDTVVLDDALAVMIDALDAHGGVIGPLLLNPDRSVQPSYGSFPSLWTEFLFQSFLFKVVPVPFPLGRRIHPLQGAAYRRHHTVGWITGAALAAPRSVFEQTGPLDESIFMYGEDVDWCWRAQKCGAEVHHLPQARIVHIKGGSTNRNYARWISSYTQASLRFFARYRSGGALRAAGLITAGGALLRLLLWSMAAVVPSRRQEAASRREGYAQALQLSMRALRGQFT